MNSVIVEEQKHKRQFSLRMVEKEILKKKRSSRMGSLFRRAVAVSRVFPFRKRFRHNKTTACSTAIIVAADSEEAQYNEKDDRSSILIRNDNLPQPLLVPLLDEDGDGDEDEDGDDLTSSTSPSCFSGGDDYLLDIQNNFFMQLLSAEVVVADSSSSIASSDSLQHIQINDSDASSATGDGDSWNTDDASHSFEVTDSCSNMQSTTAPSPPILFVCIPNNFNHADALLVVQDNDKNNENTAADDVDTDNTPSMTAMKSYWADRQRRHTETRTRERERRRDVLLLQKKQKQVLQLSSSSLLLLLSNSNSNINMNINSNNVTISSDTRKVTTFT